MKKFTPHAKHRRSIVETLAMGLALTSVIVGLAGVPAFGDERHGDERRGRKVERHDERWYREHHRRPPVQVYEYQPAPPPVVYAPPPPSPGISLIFPIHIR